MILVEKLILPRVQLHQNPTKPARRMLLKRKNFSRDRIQSLKLRLRLNLDCQKFQGPNLQSPNLVGVNLKLATSKPSRQLRHRSTNRQRRRILAKILARKSWWTIRWA